MWPESPTITARALGIAALMSHLGLSDAEEDALVAFMQTLSDGFMSRDQP